jgi:hypothetical protein
MTHLAELSAAARDDTMEYLVKVEQEREARARERRKRVEEELVRIRADSQQVLELIYSSVGVLGI